jgi:hypothetical protein
MDIQLPGDRFVSRALFLRDSVMSGPHNLSTACSNEPVGYRWFMRLLRPLVYLWAAPTTAVGVPLVIAALLTGARARWVDGVLEVHGGLVSIFLRRVVGISLSGGASAMTLGHIVIGRDAQALERTRSHERVHVRQCERWGPLFIPAYLAASLYLWLRGADAYRDNPFEREAYESDARRIAHNTQERL